MAEQTDQKKRFLPAVEEQMLETWRKEKTFQESLKQREGAPYFSFYDGPPFANGLPHFGHSLVTSIKDSLGRYKTMRGYYVERRNGWDCHGLPVEFAIEKQFGVSGKKQILELGLDKFNAACRESVFKYKADWEAFFERIGRWTDTEHAYATIDRSYTESVWWVMRKVHEAGLLYKGFKSMPYCPRCETPLSNFEVNEGYRDNVPDPSLFVKFKLLDEDAALLGWTTTPWSLPGNAAVALNPEARYVYVSFTNDNGQEETVILAKNRLSVLDEKDYRIVKEVAAKELVGKKYQPLFDVASVAEDPARDKLYRVWEAPFVSIEEGTGVLHVAPAFGEDDLNLGLQHGLPVLSTVDTGGHMKPGLGFDKVNGLFFKDADRPIIEHLTEKDAVFAAETFKHTYPFCYRCDSPLLYYAISTWFIAVSKIKDDMLKAAESIDWTPEHIKYGRFGKWLESARDWAVSRNRYWGAPMPIWVNVADETDYIVVSSVAELEELAGKKFDLSDLHRPYIDAVTFEKDGKTYKRVEEVLDCWFESGSMPVAQQHYPFENEEKFRQTFPADYIGEGLDQTRLWFYVLHVIATILFEKPAYKHVLVNGMIMAADGQKLSKRLKNYPPIEEVFADEGADTLRLYLLSSYPAVSGDYMRFNREAMKDMNRNVLGTLLNSYNFLKMYADIDQWRPSKPGTAPQSSNLLDQWMLARLQQTINEVTEAADQYKLAHAINPIFALIDDMSNWYIRRSRRRFWKSEDDTDKQMAYETLWYTLLRTTQLLAPWAPFLSDYLWRQLAVGTNKLPASVHLSDWPAVSEPDQEVLTEMRQAREAIAEGLKQRATASIKVRQPLAKATVWDTINPSYKHNAELLRIMADELNIKEVVYDASGGTKKPAENGARIELDTTVTPELKREGLARDVVRHVQNARKNAGLEVDDRIALSLTTTDAELRQAVDEFADTIKHETLALTLDDSTYAHRETVKIEGRELSASLEKAK